MKSLFARATLLLFVCASLKVCAGDAVALRLYQYSPSLSTGNPVSITVQAVDSTGRTAKNYTGSIQITSADRLAAFPANYTFTAFDAGIHTFEITFRRAGGQSINVQDAANPLLNVTITIPVSSKQFSN